MTSGLDRMTGADRFVGQSALIVAMDEVGSVVDHWRRQYDPVATSVPPHVTVLYPFLPLDRIDDAVCTELTALFAGQPAFEATLTGCARFPEVFYLRAQPEATFQQLTAVVHQRWPEAPPYGGQFETVIPHLTVAHSGDAAIHLELELEIGPLLPLTVGVREVQLIGCGESWLELARFPLAGV
jgi:2'-5' RNA ligase